MSVGTGLFFIGMVVLYIGTKDRWDWQKIVLWSLFALGLLVIGISIATLKKQYDERPKKLTEFWGVSLNESAGDVKFKKGEPTRRINNDLWIYKPYETIAGEYAVYFNNNRVRSIMYFGPKSNSPYLHGLEDNDSPQELDAKFGPPSYVSRSKDELRRSYSYEKFNVVVNFEEGMMSALGIYDPTTSAFKFSDELNGTTSTK